MQQMHYLTAYFIHHWYLEMYIKLFQKSKDLNKKKLEKDRTFLDMAFSILK